VLVNSFQIYVDGSGGDNDDDDDVMVLILSQV
jgi:hypothetical protein